MASAVDMMNVDSASAARRRRERRLRQFLRHERLSVAMALSEKKHHTSRGQRMDRAGRWVRDPLHGQVPGAPTPQPELFQLFEEELGVPAGLSGRAAGASGGGSAPHCGAARRPTSSPWCRCSTLLGCWGSLGWRTSCVRLMRRRWTSWLSPCQRSRWSGLRVVGETIFARRRLQISWWKCRRSYPSLLYSSGLPSSSSTFRFLRFGGEVAEVFMVFVQDRVQQRFVEQNSLTFQFLQDVVRGSVVEAFKVSPRDRIQQRTWSSTLTFLLVLVFTVFSLDRVLPHRAVCLSMPMKEFKGVFALFPVREKVRGWVRTRGRN